LTFEDEIRKYDFEDAVAHALDWRISKWHAEGNWVAILHEKASTSNLGQL
jgi:hypothetical protein